VPKPTESVPGSGDYKIGKSRAIITLDGIKNMLQASVCCSTPWLAAGASIGKKSGARTKQYINSHTFYELPMLHKHAQTIGLLAAYVL
jgi:hypothetical protein